MTLTLIIDRRRGIQMIGFYDYTVVLTYISMMISNVWNNFVHGWTF